LPFVSSVDKAHEAVRRIDRAASDEGLRPIIFSTLVQDELRDIVMNANGLFLDLFSAFVGPLERELNTRSTHRAGRAHGIADLAAYTMRINATNFALANDDLEAGKLPARLEPFRRKLFGLTIRPERLQQIRTERRPESRYASRAQVQYELRAADAMFVRFGVPSLDTSESSIEEIASRILNTTGIERRLRP